MKRIILLFLALSMVLTMGIVANASFTYEEYPIAENDADYESVLELYDRTMYSTKYQIEEESDTFWFSSTNEYVAQRIDLKVAADIISFGAGGAGTVDVALYHYEGSVDASIEGTPIASETLNIIYSGWRNGLELPATIQPGSYVLKLSNPSDPYGFWIAASDYAEGMAPASNEISYQTNRGYANLDTGGIAFSTYLSKSDSPADAMSMTLSSAECAPGETVTLSCMASGIPQNILGLEFMIQVDPAFSIVELRDGTSVALDGRDVNIEENVLGVCMDTLYGVDINGTVFYVDIAIPEDAAPGTYEITFDKFMVSDEDFNEFYFLEDAYAAITVTGDNQPTDEPTDEPTSEPTDEPTSEPTDEPTSEPTDEPVDDTLTGDANGDGKVNMADVVAIRRYLVNSEKYPITVPEAADVNGDDKINMADVVAIRRYLVNAETYPLGR